METVICFQCSDSFELTDSHVQTYNDSGLCPKCFGSAMEELNPQQAILGKLDTIIENMKLMNTILLKTYEEVIYANKRLFEEKKKCKSDIQSA
jgi:hypothetical protein